MIVISGNLTLDEREFDERFVRASGPGGQNVNKVASAVQLRFDVARSSLDGDVKQRLTRLAGSRLTGEGVLVIDSRSHRTQAQNREAARERLAELIRRALTPPKPRRRTRLPVASREARLTGKKQRSEVKSLRGSRPARED